LEPSLPLPIPTPDFTTGDLLLFGSFYSLDTKNRDKVLKITETAKKNGVLILYDPNIRKVHCPLSTQEKEWFLENLSLADMVRGSDEDFKNVFETESLATIYDMVQQQGCRHLFLMKGAGGAFYKNDDVELQIPAKPLQPISSIGAGDTFNAGILYGISQRLPLPLDNLPAHAEDIMKTAVEMASEVCMSKENYILKPRITQIITNKLV